MSTSFLGCGPGSARMYSNETPELKLEEYFAEPAYGTGVFFDRFGRVKSSFEVDLSGSKKNDYFELVEDLRYSNGEKLKRVYTIRKVGDNIFEAVTVPQRVPGSIDGDSIGDGNKGAADELNHEGVVGKATIEQFGNTLHWTYRLRQDIGKGSLWTFAFDDWMFLQKDGTILNRAWASKWGIGVGEVFMSLRKGTRPHP